MKINKKLLFIGVLLLGLVFNVQVFAATAWTTGTGLVWSDGKVGVANNTPQTLLDLGTSTYNYDITLRATTNASHQPAVALSSNGFTWNMYKPIGSNDLSFFDGTLNSVALGNNTAGAKLWIKNNANNNTFIGLNNTADGSIYRFNSGGSKLTLAVHDGTNGNDYDVMSFTRAGNIDIGNNAHNVTMTLNGGLKTRMIQVTNTGWADYVFDESYKLKPLSEVQEYINQNKHLPDVPSAQEVEQNGLSLGDMQKTQMQKIEELTLYILKLDERVNKLENENSELKKL